jgi:hypothetical protein
MVGVAEYKMEKEKRREKGEGKARRSGARRTGQGGVEGLAHPANPTPEIRQWLTAVVDGPPSKLASPWPPAVCQFTVNPLHSLLCAGPCP